MASVRTWSMPDKTCRIKRNNPRLRESPLAAEGAKQSGRKISRLCGFFLILVNGCDGKLRYRPPARTAATRRTSQAVKSGLNFSIN